MALPNDVIIEIFEYLEFPQIWQLQYLNKSLRKLMKERRWKQIFYHKNLTDNILINIIKNWNICKMDLSRFSENLTNESLKQLGNMKYINLRECFQVRDNIVKKFKNVKYLNLCGCENITDKGVKELKNVEELNLYNCWQVTDESIKLLCNVRILNLSYCDAITDKSIKCLKNIEELNICGCNVTDDGVIGLTKLKSLEIDRLITDECVGTLEKRGVLVTHCIVLKHYLFYEQ